MRRTAHLLLIALLLAACGGWRGGDRLMSRADSLMYARPDAALALLDSIPEADRARMSKGQRMRYELLRLSAQNKCDTLFRSDSLQLMLTEYYDHHGTANERMTAYYLLGRAYADMGEAPAALQAYHSACDIAETSGCNLDLKMLSRIHGQIAWLFIRAQSPRNAIKELQKVLSIAKQEGDTILFAQSLSTMGRAYEQLNDLDSALLLSEQASSVFSECGYHDKAAMAVAPVLDVLIRQKNLSKAKSFMDRYEAVGSLFDSVGGIKPGYEIYYNTKGQYFYELGKTDSARFYFRKLLSRARNINDYECGYIGLARVFDRLGQQDSAAHYSLLAYNMNDSNHREKATADFQRNQAIYNFTRYQQQAAEQKHQAEKTKSYWLITLSLSILFVSICVIIIIVLRNKKKRINLLKEDLHSKYGELVLAKKELTKLLAVKETKLSENETTIARITSKEKDMSEEILNEKNKNMALIKQIQHIDSEVSRLSQEKESVLSEWKKKESVLQEIITQKKKEIDNKEKQIAYLKNALGIKHDSEYDEKIESSHIVINLKKELYSSEFVLSNQQWESLKESIDNLFPDIQKLLREIYPEIRLDEEKILYLTKATFKPGQIAFLMQMKSSAVSMSKKRLLEKLFGIKNGSTKDFDRLVCDMQ